MGRPGGGRRAGGEDSAGACRGGRGGVCDRPPAGLWPPLAAGVPQEVRAGLALSCSLRGRQGGEEVQGCLAVMSQDGGACFPQQGARVQKCLQPTHAFICSFGRPAATHCACAHLAACWPSRLGPTPTGGALCVAAASCEPAASFGGTRAAPPRGPTRSRARTAGWRSGERVRLPRAGWVRAPPVVPFSGGCGLGSGRCTMEAPRWPHGRGVVTRGPRYTCLEECAAPWPPGGKREVG